MRLAAICEGDARRDDPAGDRPAVPDDRGEAHALFRRGLRAMRARNDAAAFRILSHLCLYDGDAPPGLLRSARAARDFLDPDRPADRKAETLCKFFAPTAGRRSDAPKTPPGSQK